MERVKQQPGEGVFHLMSHLGRRASQSSYPFLLDRPFVSLDEFGCAFSNARLELFSMSFYLLLEPALFIRKPLLLRRPRNRIEQHVLNDWFCDKIICAGANDLRYLSKIRFARNYYDG